MIDLSYVHRKDPDCEQQRSKYQYYYQSWILSFCRCCRIDYQWLMQPTSCHSLFNFFLEKARYFLCWSNPQKRSHSPAVAKKKKKPAGISFCGRWTKKSILDRKGENEPATWQGFPQNVYSLKFEAVMGSEDDFPVDKIFGLSVISNRMPWRTWTSLRENWRRGVTVTRVEILENNLKS